jgi:FdrA protein
VGVAIPIIRDIQKNAKSAGRHITFVASVLGTDKDLQNRQYSTARLRDLGVLIGETNAQAARIAQAITDRLV